MFDLVNQQQITTLVIPTGGILDLSMASDGCTISACDQTGQVLLYDLRNLKTPFQTITSASEAAILCCSFQYSAPKPQKRVLSEASSMLTPNLILRTSSEADLSHSTIHEIENPQSAPGCLSADFSVPSNQEENAPVPKISVEDTSKKPILIHQDNEPRLAQPASHEAPSVESFVPLDGQSPVKTKDEVPKFVQSDSFSKRELQERFNKIHTEISSVREELSQEIQNLHLDLLRQFHLVHVLFLSF